MNYNNQTITQPSKEIPVIGKADVCVIGSGIAGISAAIAAARNGVKVTLVEKENCPGGLATLGIVYIYLPLCDGYGHKLIGGLAEELLKVSIKYGPGRISSIWQRNSMINKNTKKRYMTPFNPASFIISLEELILENNIEILYDTRFSDVVKEGNSIAALIVENKGGRSAILTRTVVDATGDADVCYIAGENTVSQDNNRMSSWFYSYDRKNLKRYMLGDPFWGELPKGSRTYSGDNYKDVTAFSIVGRKMILKKIIEKKKIFKDIYPILIPTLPQFRMTRRLKGSYELSDKDQNKYFVDTVGMVGDWKKSGPVYCIPYRSLTAVKTANLIAAGRCISASGDGWDVTRAIGPCALTGEIAGTSAALSLKQGIDIKSINIKTLQDKLRQQNNIINENLMPSFRD